MKFLCFRQQLSRNRTGSSSVSKISEAQKSIFGKIRERKNPQKRFKLQWDKHFFIALALLKSNPTESQRKHIRFNLLKPLKWGRCVEFDDLTKA